MDDDGRTRRAVALLWNVTAALLAIGAMTITVIQLAPPDRPVYRGRRRPEHRHRCLAAQANTRLKRARRRRRARHRG